MGSLNVQCLLDGIRSNCCTVAWPHCHCPLFVCPFLLPNLVTSIGIGLYGHWCVPSIVCGPLFPIRSGAILCLTLVPNLAWHMWHMAHLIPSSQFGMPFDTGFVLKLALTLPCLWQAVGSFVLAPLFHSLMCHCTLSVPFFPIW